MKQISKENIWEILNQLYNSEINIAISTFWDWGYFYTLDVKPYEEQKIINCTDEKDIVKVFNIIVADVLQTYPDSTFTKWFNS